MTKLVPNLWENACVVMDNASIHKSQMVEEAIQEVGAKLIYPTFRISKNTYTECLRKFFGLSNHFLKMATNLEL